MESQVAHCWTVFWLLYLKIPLCPYRQYHISHYGCNNITVTDSSGVSLTKMVEDTEMNGASPSEATIICKKAEPSNVTTTCSTLVDAYQTRNEK